MVSTLAMLLAGIALAAKKATPPSITLFPAGAQRGTTSTITLSGKVEGDGIGMAIDCPGVLLTMLPKNQVQVTIAPDAPLGLHLVHVFNESGASDPRWFSIGDLPEIQEKEPNDALTAAMPIDKLPVCINGQLEKRGTADLFSIKLDAGQTLTAVVEGYALGSLVDPILELRDENNSIVATEHDGRNLDPVMSYKATKAGRYLLQLAGFAHPPAADVNFVGGSGITYRLHLTASAAALRVFPAAVSRTSKTKLDVLGSSIGDKDKTLDFDGNRLVGPIALIKTTNAFLPIPVAVTDTTVQRETDSNHDFATAMPLPIPSCVGGRIAKQGEADFYAFDAKKGSYTNVRLLAKALGLHLDATLVIIDKDGKELATNDDAAEGEDPLISWKAPADGRYAVRITDLFGKGGDDAEYVLQLGPGEETFGAAITSKPTLAIEAGKTAEIKAKLKRVNGYAGELIARVSGLPASVSCADIEAPKKNGEEFTLKLQAATDAVAFNGPISVVLWTKESKDKPLLSRTATLDLRGENRRGSSTLDVTERLWLTVVPATPVIPAVVLPAPKPETAKLTAPETAPKAEASKPATPPPPKPEAAKPAVPDTKAK